MATQKSLIASLALSEKTFKDLDQQVNDDITASFDLLHERIPKLRSIRFDSPRMPLIDDWYADGCTISKGEVLVLAVTKIGSSVGRTFRLSELSLEARMKLFAYFVSIL